MAGTETSANPWADARGQGGMPVQHQGWPGHESSLHPPADHGESTYRGSGKLEGKVALVTGGVLIGTRSAQAAPVNPS